MRNNCLCYACNGSVCRKSNIVENFGHFTAFYGNTTVTNLEGPLAGKQLSELLNSMHSMEVYVNFHTTEYPDGNKYQIQQAV